ncbi:AsmA-like C-terminal domain-containing protein [Wolbachia endosymbiont of Pentalonia nigronervosa]|jgi:hypothetical protein|uniref:YhdP family protein n=1 Tax=Wolbachia endosymbiont of Pentalonia nigronervosa TaxID=1301914 RepID=UPI00165FFBB0|nr:AsmA-like C-terminal domain-containing protein [Wolbachia endosymbiont of Pentalonia nigronervosa]MBD0391589.1 AsmA-like C-terminal domain-containing protein [Wolbachia endosymbiont of Pentalonia nigronervosa]
MLKKIAVLLLIILLFLSCFVAYLKSKDSVKINVNYINFYIKNKVSKISTDAKVSIQNTSFTWQKGEEPYLIITELSIKNRDFTIKVPELFIRFKLSSLFKARANFSHILADNVHVYVDNKETKAADFNLSDSLKVVRELFFGLDENSKIEFTNMVVNKDTKNEFYIDKLYISKKRNLNIHIYTKNDKGMVDDLSITIKNHNNLLSVYGAFYNLKLGLLDEFCMLTKNHELSKDVKLKGSFSFKMNEKEVLDGETYILSVTPASTTKLPSEIELQKRSNVNVKLAYHNRVLDIKNFHFKFNDIYLSLIGKIYLSKNHASLRANISKFATQDLCTYVPDGMVNDEFKNWYCSNIAGDILNTIIDFSGKINSGNLSDITVIADIENGSVKFDDDFAPVEKLNGSLKLKSNNLKITINDAKFQGFAVNSGDIEMNSIDKEDSVFTIHGQAVSDAYALYEPIKSKLDKIVAIERDKVSGAAKSEFSFQVFNLNADNKAVDFLGNIHSKIDDLIIYKSDIGKYNVDLKFGSNFLELNSGGLVNNKQLQFNCKERNKNHTCRFTGDFPAQIINADGYVNIDVESVVNSDDTGSISGDIDLSNLISRASYLGWKNRFEDRNKIAFSIGLKGNDKLSVDKIDVTGNNLNIRLNGKVEDGILSLNSSNFNLPDNDFNMEIKANKQKSSVMIYGEKINFSDILELLTKSDSDSQRDIEVRMDVDNMIMKDDIIINNAQLNLTCTQGDCSGSQFTGKFLQDGSDILAKYSGIGLEVYANNAGMLLRSLGINKTVKGGRISFYFSTKRGDNTHYGMVSISNFYIKDAPLLTTLLSLSSLPGIVNAINRGGIYFYKFNAPFSYSNGIIGIEESWLEGAELGITASGKLNVQDHKFQITGQVIPAYSVNKFVSKIPIIGKVLTGGKSRGVVAIDYKAHGDDKNSNVFVNFISSLTPNLLKRVLGIFDRIMIKTNKTIVKAIVGLTTTP